MNLIAESTEVMDLNQAIRRIAEFRDRDAFIIVYNFFSPRLKSYLITQRMSVMNAEELVQETMLRIWQKSKMFNPDKSSASTWIFTIARNLRIDSIRKNKLPMINIDEVSEQIDSQPDPEHQADRNQRQKNIAHALTLLPSKQFQVVFMSFFQDKSHGEISEELQIPLGTVKSRMRLAFERLRTNVRGNL